MALLQLINCLTLCFMPQIIYYYATTLVEYSLFSSVFYAACVQCVNIFGKVVLLACLLPGTELSPNELWKNIAQILVSIVDIGGIYFALNAKNIHKTISDEHKFQAIGIGWAFGHSLLHRFFPIWINGMSPEFSLDNIFQAIRSNIVIIHSLSFAAIATIAFNRRSKNGLFGIIIKSMLIILAVLPIVISLLEEEFGIVDFKALSLEFLLNTLFAIFTYLIYKVFYLNNV